MPDHHIPYDRNDNAELTPFQLTRSFMNDPYFRDYGFSPYYSWGRIKADVKDLGDEFLVEAELPGAKDKIDIDVDEGVLTISVHGAEEKNVNDQQFVYRERHSGTVSRSFRLSNIDENGIKAEYKDGILSVHLPKTDKGRKTPKKIEIH